MSFWFLRGMLAYLSTISVNDVLLICSLFSFLLLLSATVLEHQVKKHT